MGTSSLLAQTLNKPEAAPNPNIGGSTAWTAACGSADFNDYYVNFTWSPPLVGSDNSFILQLSDANGSFSNPTTLATATDKNTTFDFEFKFSLPETTRGEGYKFRVKSTNPEKISPESDAYAMYYINYKSPLLISPNGDGNIPSGGVIEVCDGAAVTLAPHNIPNKSTYQYNWYRGTTPLSEKGPELTVSTAGMYFVEIDYGSACSGSANTLSNTIEIKSGNKVGIAINTPSKTSLCSSESVTLTANITNQGLTYTWYKDDVAITTPTVDAASFTVDGSVDGFEGNYAVEIYGDGTCLEKSAIVAITNAGQYTVSRVNEASLVLLPGQEQQLSVSTTASNPSYQWYKDGTLINGETNSTYTAVVAGNYYAAVSQTGGACSATVITSDVTTIVTPESFVLSIDYSSDYTACSNTSMVLGVSTIEAVDSEGLKTDVTADVSSSFNYQWKKDGEAISGATGATISLTDISENGSYTLIASTEDYNATSNSLSLQLLVNETLVIESTGTVFCSGGDTIAISTTADLSDSTFEWLKDGESFNTSTEELNVNSIGKYQLVVNRNGCPLLSNEIIILPIDESLVTLDTDSNVVIPEGTSKTITANGGTSYEWFDSNNSLVSSSSSLTVDTEGEYLLIAQIDNCTLTKTVTVAYLETFSVPNVITPNGDGSNDQWVLPNSYSNKSDVSVIIYNNKGVEILNETNYQNNWPQSTTSFAKQDQIFYYVIKNASETLKKGTITVIR